ncbi:fcd-2 [Pristionchus pacificus]|uniref:Fcd-2 n=1 Tax=Pristionchus pacificus TaxID=54126 RepID=A0A2A6CSB3_PRIPA|nr:fcd-2 [Pristionchus pacificus]|eukprot:PDM81085.1 fcd-2 [Pristionchus pacificus]
MEDDDDFDLDFPDDIQKENASPGKKSTNLRDDERDSLREGLRQFSQRSQGAAPPPEDDGEEVESRSGFERLLKEKHGVELRRDEDGKEYFYLSRHLNHLAFVNHLNAVLSHGKGDELMDEFRSSIDGKLILFLYFAPMKSRSGEQDTLWKALLLCRETQNRSFDLLMEEMQKLGKDDSTESRDLALVAVSHIRFLDCVFDSKILFDFVFDRDFHKWKPCVRDELIQAIPEVFGDIVSQNDAAMNLLRLITESTVEDEPNDFKIAILNSLKLLTTGKEEATEIRSKLIKRMNSMEARAAIEVVNMVLDGLDTNDLPTLHEVLTLFSQHFKLKFQPTMGTKNKKSKDDVAIAIGAKIGRFIQLSGNKCWRVIGPFLRSLTCDSERSENGEEDNQPIRTWRIFDIILCISLMSIEGCPPSVGATLKSQIADETREEGILEEKFKKIIEMNKFCLLHFPSLIRFSRSLLWSPLDSHNHFSTFIYSSLLRSLEKKRKETLSSMLSHLDKSEREAVSILDSILIIVKQEYSIIQDHVHLIHESFLSLLPSLTLTSARMMLTVVISICMKDPTQSALKLDMEETSRRLLSSLSSRDESLGIVCMVMQLQSALNDQNGVNREDDIHTLLDNLTVATKGSSLLRWTLYDEIRLMLVRSSKWKPSEKFVCFMEWAEALEETFKDEFFHERIDDETHSQTLEADKYVNDNSSQWLQVSHERLVELVPLFGLLKELSVLKCRWKNDEETQEAVMSSFHQFMYTFEANITMCGARGIWNIENYELLVNSTIFFHLIQWIRTLLNSFCEKEEPEDSYLSKLKMMKFSLLFDLEKSLIHTIKQLGEVRVPSSIVKDLIVIVYDENAKKPAKKRPATKKPSKKGRKKKKKNGDGEEEEEEREEEERVEEEDEVREDQENDEEKIEIMEEKRKRIPLSSLNTIFIPYKMSTVIQLMKLQVGKRIRSVYLLDNLLKIMKVVLPKKEKKALPWSVRHSPLDPPPMEYHGDGISIWKWTLSSTSPIIQQLILSSDYFKELNESQAIRDDSVEVANSMGIMLGKCLSLLNEIFTSKDVVNSTQDETGKRTNKRRNMMEIVEKKIIEASNSQVQRDAENGDAETTVLQFLLGVAENVPTIDCAVGVMECCYSLEGRDESSDECLGGWCLKYLQKEWTNEDGKIQKGTVFKNSVRRLFELYLSYRRIDDRPKAILWLLAEQLTSLVGDNEKRMSKMDSVSSPVDDFVPPQINRLKFFTLNKETFPVVYKSLFIALNSTLQVLINTRNNMSTDDLLALWSKSCSSFCLFCLLLRVGTLRSNGVLMSASKEGRRFLSIFSKPNGFMSLLEDETTFSLITTQALSIIKQVQMGNRSLQNITVYAKTNRNQSLLMTIPDLRASSETMMRCMHSALTFLGCERAFEIGLLKGRNIDGEEIKDDEREETPEDEEREGEEEEEEGGEEDVEEIEEDREDSLEKTIKEEVDEREGSPVF